MLKLVPKEPQTFYLRCGGIDITGEALTARELAQRLCDKYGFKEFTHRGERIICVPTSEVLVSE